MKKLLLALVCVVVLSGFAAAAEPTVRLHFGQFNDVSLGLKGDIVALWNSLNGDKNGSYDVYSMKGILVGYRLGEITPFLGAMNVAEEHYKDTTVIIDSKPVLVKVLDWGKEKTVAVGGVNYQVYLSDSWAVEANAMAYSYADKLKTKYDIKAKYDVWKDGNCLTIGYSKWDAGTNDKFSGLQFGIDLTFY